MRLPALTFPTLQKAVDARDSLLAHGVRVEFLRKHTVYYWERVEILRYSSAHTSYVFVGIGGIREAPGGFAVTVRFSREKPARVQSPAMSHYKWQLVEHPIPF